MIIIRDQESLQSVALPFRKHRGERTHRILEGHRHGHPLTRISSETGGSTDDPNLASYLLSRIERKAREQQPSSQVLVKQAGREEVLCLEF